MLKRNSGASTNQFYDQEYIIFSSYQKTNLPFVQNIPQEQLLILFSLFADLC